MLAIDADEHEGTHFFAMEYVEGADLAKYVKRHGPLSVAQACECIRQAALGLQHAYERGLVHRDIKPHNLLLTAAPARGVGKGADLVKVLDMGLARLNVHADDEYASSTLTQEGAVMGTPDYIAPEQAMDSRGADVRADLYSLGCTFYFLLTGQVPFPGGTVMEKLLKHQNQPPRSVLDFRADVPPAVAAVVHRLMAKRPEQRFQTPAELLVALAAAMTAPLESDSHLAETLITETPIPPAAHSDTFADLRPDTVPSGDDHGRARQAVERKQLLLLSAGGVGALLALVLLLVLLFRGGAKDHLVTDNTSKGGPPPSTETADKEWKVLRARGEASGVDRAKWREELLAFRRTHPGTGAALEAAEGLMRLLSPLDQLSAMPLSPEQKLDGQPKELLAMFGDHRSWIGVSTWMRADYSPDGRLLACNAADGSIRLLDPGTMVVKAVLKAETRLATWDFRHDSKAMVTCGEGVVRFWDVSGDRPRQIGMLNDATAGMGHIAYSPDGKRLAVVCSDKTPIVRLWELSAAEPKEWAVLRGHKENICKPAFSPDGKTLVTGSQDHTIRVWDLSGSEPKERAVLKNHTYWVVSVAFSPDGKVLASSGQHDYIVRLWDMTQAEPKELTAPNLDAAMNNVAFSPDGKRLAAGFWNQTWRLWDVSERQLKQLAVVPDHTGINLNVHFAPDGRTLVSVCDDGTIHLWDITQNPPRQRFVSPSHGQCVRGLAFTPDDHTLVSLSSDGTARLWDMRALTGRERATLPLQTGFVYGALHPDGQILVTGDGRDQHILWDIVAGKELRSLPGRIWLVAYRPDGKELVAIAEGYTVKFWDVESGAVQRVEHLEQDAIPRALAISPDGRRLAVSNDKGMIHLWNTRNQQEHRRCATPDGCAAVLAYSPDGKTLAAAGKDGRVRLIDAAKGAERSSLPDHEKDISFVAFTPDGKQILSAGLDGQVIVRDSITGKTKQTLRSPLPIHAAALSSDGRHLAIGHVDGTVYLLRLATPPRERAACGLALGGCRVVYVSRET